MSKRKIWNLHMTYDGPATEGYATDMIVLAESIAREPGLIWKTWTFETGTNRLVSWYLFEDLPSLEAYRDMHIKRLGTYGIDLKADHILEIMDDVNEITNAPVFA